MTRFFALALAALAATAEAGVCRPRPKPNTTAPVPVPEVSAYGATSVPLPGASGAPGNTTAPPETAPNTTVPEPTTPDNTTAPPAESNNTAPVAGSAPEGTDKSKPWNPVDPTGAANITANPTAADIDGSSPIASWLLSYHNTLRAEYGASALTWDAKLAQGSAEQTKGCAWAHEGNDNLAERSASGSELNYGAGSFLDMWADEWPETFSGGDAVNGDVVTLNHLTLMLWKDVTAVGCSWNVDCPANGMDHKVYLTCKYSPTGNIVGSENDQVPNYIPA